VFLDQAVVFKLRESTAFLGSQVGDGAVVNSD
jgi:hypothetical protein